MIKHRIFFLFLVILTMTGCSEEIKSLFADCNNCQSLEPIEVALNVKLTINTENPRVPITVYLGDYEYNKVVLTDTTSEEEVHYALPVNKKYSVVARYKVGNKIVYAIDGDKVSSKNSSSDCNTDCWIVTEGNADVRLKKQ